MAYKQAAGTSNEAFRDEWVASSLTRLGGNLAQRLRGRLSADVLQSGAFGTLFIGCRPQ